MTEVGRDFVFAGSVRLRIHGAERWVRHFAAEYEESAAGPAGPDVVVQLRYGRHVERPPDGIVVAGGHKSARWRVALGAAAARPLEAWIAIGGGPPAFTLSLVQGYFVEALVAVALSRTGRVALPGAGLGEDDGALLLLGRSGAGKTTLTARALSAGRPVLSDDQVILDPAAGAWRYPRRLRLYPDVRATAPDAWSRLPVGTRSTLTVRRAVRQLTLGYIAPSLAVPAARIGSTVEPGPLPVTRLVVVDRADCASFSTVPRDAEWAVEQAALILADQRARLSRGVRGDWADALAATVAAERAAVAAALADVPTTEVRIPRAWPAPRAVDALASHLGITPGSATAPGDPSSRRR